MVFICPGKVLQLGTAIGNLDEGAIITLNENASPVEFYIAKQDYESGLNGAGRTLVVRKDIYDNRQWNNSNVNAWASSALLAWFNGDYKALLDERVQQAIGTTIYYYTPGNGNNAVTTMQSSVFSLSLTELGLSASDANAEGNILPISGILQTTTDGQLTRTPNTYASDHIYVVTPSKTVASFYASESSGSRPCFTLPATFKLPDSQIIA